MTQALGLLTEASDVAVLQFFVAATSGLTLWMAFRELWKRPDLMTRHKSLTTRRLHERFRHRSVVLVEDDGTLRRLGKILFSGAGIHVRLASTVAEALPFGATDKCLVTDWLLDDGTGADIIRAYRAEDPDRPVIVISGLTEPDNLPFDNITWLVKPLDLDELLTLVLGALSR